MDRQHLYSCLIFLFIQLFCTTLTSYIWKAEIGHCDTDQNGTIWKCNYIPEDIPDGFSRVDIEIRDFDIHCYNTSFQSNNWQHVDTLKLFTPTIWIGKDVTLHEHCFRNLRNLKYLFINIGFSFNLLPDAFTGANSVTMLSLANCVRLKWNILQESLDGPAKLPNLTDLDLSKVHTILGPVDIDEQFVDALGTRNLTRLNLSGMQVSYINGTALLALPYLSHINLTSVNLNDYTVDLPPETIKRIKEVDVSHIILPKAVVDPGVHTYFNVHVRYDKTHKEIRNSVLGISLIKKLIANGIFDKAVYELHNCEFTLNTFLPIKTETLICKDNGLKHIDIKVSGDHTYRNTTLKHMDISRNDMEFLHPTILSVASNLISLRLSENKLYKMLKKDITLFEKLFSYNYKLTMIDISSNELDRIATHQFIHNVYLEEINLSNNLLQQVNWDMDKHTHLHILDLRNNRISILDSISLNNLDSLISSLSTKVQLVFHIENNPITCSKCKSKTFISWLTQTSSLYIKSTNTLTCTKENGEQGSIDKSQLQHLQLICLRKTIILSCTTTLGAVVIAIVVLTYVLIRRRKIHRRHMKHTELLANIQQGEGEFEFVTMLSYSSQEAEFIRQYVIDPLNNTLQTITGIDRDLVLTGDEHFRPGYMVHNEIASSLDRVSLVVLLITNDFCTSGYCLSELDQTWIHRKPMIFMFKDDVDENLMTPIMKTIYKKNVRILWTMEDGEYVLKTTWENVCQSILELIIN